MTKKTTFISGISILALSACMGGGGGGDDQDGITSRGILTFQLPDEAQRAEFPEELEKMVNEIEDLNENGTLEVSLGDSVYTGLFGIEVNNDDDATLIYGDARITVSNSAANVEYDFEATDIDDVDFDTVSGSFGGTTTQSGGLYDGDLSGALTLGGTDVEGVVINIDGNLEGAFTTTDDTFGVLDGSVSEAGSSDFADFTGLYLARD